MHVIIAGGSGFVGSKLCSILAIHRYQVTILTHTDPESAAEKLYQRYHLDNKIEILTYDQYQGDGDVFINFAGESFGQKSINSRRLTTLLKSRINTLEKLSTKPKLPPIFMQASSVAVYKDSDEVQDETSPATADGEIADLARAVERRANLLNQQFKFERFYITRFGIVLGRSGGFMRKVCSVPPFKLLHADNSLPFIELDDTILAFLMLCEGKVPSGIVNVTSPYPATLADIINCCFKNSRLPPIPIMTGLLHLGDKRITLLKANQKIMPKVLLTNGFKFYKGHIDSIN